jgi:hypothetical protein
MKAKTLNNRLIKLQGISKTSKAYHVIKELTGMYTSRNNWNQEQPFSSYMVFKNNLIRPVYTYGSGSHTSYQDHTIAITSLLDKLKVKYVVDNDAPRGGQCGAYIKIITKIVK